jgi:alcohol dehydrogenase
MRFNHDAAAAELALVAEALGISRGGREDAALAEAAAQHVFDMIGSMSLPQRLRDVGVDQGDLAQLAALAFEGRTVHNNPRPIVDAGQIEELLRKAW